MSSNFGNLNSSTSLYDNFLVLPEVIDLTVGMGHDVGVVFDVEVVPEDGCYELRQSGVAGIGGVVKAVLAIAIVVIEANAFRWVAESLGFLQGVKVDDRDLLAHLAGHSVVAGDGDVKIFIGPGLTDVGGNDSTLIGARDAGGNYLKLEPWDRGVA